MRKKVNSSKVMRSISLALAVMVAGTVAVPMNVQAVDDHGYGYVDENKGQYNYTETSNDADAEAMTDAADEAKKAAEEASKLLEDVNSNLEEAEKAAETIGAPEEKDENENVTKEATGVYEDMENAVDAAESAGEEATDTAEDADTRADALVDKAKDYNDEIDDAQEEINTAVENVNGTLTVTEGEEQKALDEYVAEKKDAAQAAADAAHKALGEALAIDTTEVTEEVKDKVAEVDQAAKDAQKAADEAQAAADAAQKAYDDSVKLYNDYAMMYGLPLYGETEVTYTAEDLEEAGIVSKAGEGEAIEEEKEAIESIDMSGLADTIQNQEDEIEELNKTVKTAQEAAKAAQEAAKKLVEGETNQETGETVKGINDYVEEVNNAYTSVADYYVSPAKDAEAAAKEKDDLAKEAVKKAQEEQTKINAEQQAEIKAQEEIKTQQSAIVDSKTNEKNTILNSTEYTDSQNFIKTAEAKTGLFGWRKSELEEKQDIIEEGVGYWKKTFFGKVFVGYTQEEVDAAKAYVAKYEAAQTYVKDANDKLTNLDGEISAANSKINDADSKIAAAKQVMQDKQTEVDVLVNNQTQASQNLADATAKREAAEAVRDEYVKAAEEALNQQATEALIEEIQKVLSERSEAVNQVEFDKDLNAWANGTIEKYENIELNWEFWKTIADIAKVTEDSKDIRKYMDEHYDANSKFIDFINYLEISQWIVSTEDTEAVMEAAIKVYREQMKQNEEKLATVEAYLANVSANATAEEAKAAMEQLAQYVAIAETAQKALVEANDKVADAQQAYDDASDKLDAAKEKVKNVRAGSLEMQELLNAIAKAEDLLRQSEENLKVAQESAQLAANYKNFANKLVTTQYATAYAQKNEEGLTFGNIYEFDMTDEDVVSRGSGKFVQVSDKKNSVVIPYDVYRSYLTALYNKYPDEALVEKNGTGISTGGSMSVVYWAMDENNKLTGEFAMNEDELISGTRYFIGYAFKKEGDGYHLDGFAFDFTREEEFPEDGDNDGNGGNGGTQSSFTPAVLGAQRTAQPVAEQPVAEQTGDVLGASRTTENATEVLGESRPQTGDDTNAWGAVAGAAVSGMLLAGYAVMKKKEENAEEEC